MTLLDNHLEQISLSSAAIAELPSVAISTAREVESNSSD